MGTKIRESIQSAAAPHVDTRRSLRSVTKSGQKKKKRAVSDSSDEGGDGQDLSQEFARVPMTKDDVTAFKEHVTTAVKGLRLSCSGTGSMCGKSENLVRCVEQLQSVVSGTVIMSTKKQKVVAGSKKKLGRSKSTSSSEVPWSLPNIYNQVVEILTTVTNLELPEVETDHLITIKDLNKITVKCNSAITEEKLVSLKDDVVQKVTESLGPIITASVKAVVQPALIAMEQRLSDVINGNMTTCMQSLRQFNTVGVPQGYNYHSYPTQPHAVGSLSSYPAQPVAHSARSSHAQGAGPSVGHNAGRTLGMNEVTNLLTQLVQNTAGHH